MVVSTQGRPTFRGGEEHLKLITIVRVEQAHSKIARRFAVEADHRSESSRRNIEEPRQIAFRRPSGGGAGGGPVKGGSFCRLDLS
jgi:hypothetical protein